MAEPGGAGPIVVFDFSSGMLSAIDLNAETKFGTVEV